MSLPGEAIDLRQALARSFRDWQEPGAAELCELLQEMLGDDGRSAPVRLERLKRDREVYRLRIGRAPGHTLVLKLLKPAIAEADRLVAERWLPALGLGDRCPRLLGAAAPRDGSGVWHISLSELRRANGVTVLADCVLDSNSAMDALFAHDTRPDWTTVSAGAAAYRATLQRCDGMAPPAIRNHAEFRRLIDGALASLDQFPRAIETRDGDLLHRLLIELRSFDHLLAFRYG